MKRPSLSTGAAVALCVAVLIAACVYFYEMQKMQAGVQTSTAFQSHTAGTIGIDGNIIHVFVADNDAERQLGLGGMSGLTSDEGMLFVFPQDEEYAFWMKDMKFSIDMVWIADNGDIVFIAPNVSPATYPENFVPTSPARYVLELPAGYTQTNNVKVGDVVQFQ